MKTVYANHREEIEDRKREAGVWEEPDWIWEAILAAFSTMGNSRGVALVREPEFHDPIRYGELANLSPAERHDRLLNSLKNAKVRMPVQKVPRLMKNFDFIQQSGGPAAIKRVVEDLIGPEKKTNFLMASFDGVGPKLARNMMMIAYHPDFRESIAVDVRINNVSKAIGLSLKRYVDKERFYVEVAHRAGISGWELDRLLYGFNEDILALIPQPEPEASL